MHQKASEDTSTQYQMQVGWHRLRSRIGFHSHNRADNVSQSLLDDEIYLARLSEGRPEAYDPHPTRRGKAPGSPGCHWAVSHVLLPSLTTRQLVTAQRPAGAAATGCREEPPPDAITSPAHTLGNISLTCNITALHFNWNTWTCNKLLKRSKNNIK